jgi:hypothetical protein
MDDTNLDNLMVPYVIVVTRQLDGRGESEEP